jgi:beta-phosphoglucomutase-like phosphatase (HAD superfamily)
MPTSMPVSRSDVPDAGVIFDCNGTLRHTIHRLAAALEELSAHLRVYSRRVHR